MSIPAATWGPFLLRMRVELYAACQLATGEQAAELAALLAELADSLDVVGPALEPPADQLPLPGLPPAAASSPQSAPGALPRGPIRVDTGALLRALIGRPPGVPLALADVGVVVARAELERWRQLAEAAGPCATGAGCPDPLCTLARALLAFDPGPA